MESIFSSIYILRCIALQVWEYKDLVTLSVVSKTLHSIIENGVFLKEKLSMCEEGPFLLDLLMINELQVQGNAKLKRLLATEMGENYSLPHDLRMSMLGYFLYIPIWESERKLWTEFNHKFEEWMEKYNRIILNGVRGDQLGEYLNASDETLHTELEKFNTHNKGGHSLTSFIAVERVKNSDTFKWSVLCLHEWRKESVIDYNISDSELVTTHKISGHNIYSTVKSHIDTVYTFYQSAEFKNMEVLGYIGSKKKKCTYRDGKNIRHWTIDKYIDISTK